MRNRFSESSLSHQLALIAAIGCLFISLALVALAVTSARHMQESQQAGFGNALAEQIAHRISASLETGDLLNIAASLHSFVNSSSATEVTFFDIEGRALGQAGKASGSRQAQYRSPVLVANDTAGEVVISIDTETTETARQRFLLSLLGLAGLLSLATYGAARQAGQRLLSSRLQRQTRTITVDENHTEPM
ncbi:MAG TPA: hypothetical protein VIC02_04130, partial [Kineobactrum sp.]